MQSTYSPVNIYVACLWYVSQVCFQITIFVSVRDKYMCIKYNQMQISLGWLLLKILSSY